MQLLEEMLQTFSVCFPKTSSVVVILRVSLTNASYLVSAENNNLT